MKGMPRICAPVLMLAVLLAAAAAWACWIQVPLEGLVTTADVIVVGKIVRVERAPGRADYEYDLGTIKVREVIKGRDVLEQLNGSARRVPLSFPAETNRLRVSTDLRYAKGQRGVWLLTLRKGRLMAARPDSLQPLTKRAEIRRLTARSPAETGEQRPLPIAIDRVE